MNIFNIVKTSRFFKHEKNKISGLERKPQLTIKGLSHGMGWVVVLCLLHHFGVYTLSPFVGRGQFFIFTWGD